jgi:tripartite-type tricarboxylate transporter receptor subunit TctC
MGNQAFTRRDFSRLGLAGGLATAVAGSLPRWANAATFPNRTVTFMVPYAAGGSFDAYAREFSELLSQQFHRNVEPLNVPGAAGNKAMFQLYHDRPDGYTISLVNIPGVLRGKSPGFDVHKLTWVANLGRDPLAVAVGTKSNLHSLDDLKQLSKTRPVKMASSGKSATDYFATEVLSKAVGIRVSNVTGFKGSVSSLLAVTRGDVDAAVHSLSAIQRLQSAGLVRLIFTFEPKTEVAGVEDATAVGVPDLGKIYQYRTVAAPPGLPKHIATTLADALTAAAAKPAAQKWAETIETVLHPLDQNATQAMIETQMQLIQKWT